MSKKTETIEVRVSPELKDELHGLSQQRGEAMSQTVRSLVEREVSLGAYPNANGENAMLNLKKTASFGGATLGLIGLAMVWNVATQAPVVAQSSVRMAFTEMDLNGDGGISEVEYNTPPAIRTDDGTLPDMEAETLPVPAECEADFDAINEAVLNGEVTGSMDEMLLDPSFEGLDSNRSGVVEFEELQVMIVSEAKRTFALYDANNDGGVTLEEFKQDIYADKRFSEACQNALDAQLPEDPYFDENTKVIFAGMDANRDDMLDEAEFIAGMW